MSSAAWRIVLGVALVLFSVGTYVGHVATTDNPEHPVVHLERASVPGLG